MSLSAATFVSKPQGGCVMADGPAASAASLFSSISFPGPLHRCTPPAASCRKLLRCGRVFDAVSEELRTSVDILVAGERIEKIGDTGTFSIPEGTEMIDLSTKTVMPGLIDCHAHILIEANDYQIQHLMQSSAFKALRGLKIVQEMLRCGWTSVRMAGDADIHFANIEVRKAIDSGMFMGPRLCGAGHYLSATGGGGDMNQLAVECKGCAPDGKVVDGCDAIRVAVREEVRHFSSFAYYRSVKYGSDWIKCLVTGAFMAAGNDPRILHWTDAEVKTIVEEATRLGKPVMAHAHSADGIKQAVRAGARSIEHGTFVCDDGLKMMKHNGVFLVPTLFIGEYYSKRGTQAGTPGLIGQQATSDEIRCMRSALASGVKLAVGTDYCGWERIEWNAKELACLHALGLPAPRVLKAATAGGAELLGWREKLGTLEVGKLADIIAVPGDPIADLSVMERVQFVMKGGIVVRNDQ